MKLNTMASTFLLSTFILGGIATETQAKTYTQAEVTVKEYRDSFSYIDDLIARQFNDGMVLLRMPDEDIGENSYAYYNTQGEVAFEVPIVRYYMNTNFHDGLVIYAEDDDDHFTYRDKEGNVVLGPYKTSNASRFIDGYAWLDTPEGRIMIDKEGNTLLSYDGTTPYAEIPHSFKYGLGVLGSDFVDLEGNVVISTGFELPEHSSMGNFTEGITSVRLFTDETYEFEYIFIDDTGTELFRKTAFNVSTYEDGLAVIGYNDPPPTSSGGIYNHGSQAVNRPKYGDSVTFMDTQGNEFPERYDAATTFSEGFAGVAKIADYDGDGTTEEKWGFIDTTGTLVIDYQFDYINYYDCFSEGLALVNVKNGITSYSTDNFYIDTAGNIVIEVEDGFTASNFNNGAAMLYKELITGEKGSVAFIRNPLLDDDYTAPTPEIETTPETEDSTSPVYSSWAEPQVTFAEENNLIVDSLGMDYTKSITRAQIADLLVNMMEQYTGTDMAEASADTFTDSTSEAVLKAYEAGIISGKGDGIFDPEATATRQEIAIMIVNAIKVLEENTGESFVDHSLTSLEGFSDFEETSDWAQNHVAILANNGIMAGSDGYLTPLSETSIQECLVLNNNLFSLSN